MTEWLVPIVSKDTGSWPSDVPQAGGVNAENGTGCKFINLLIHNTAEGITDWMPDSNSESYGCIIYNCGWKAPDRSHGHCVYTQNSYGLKTFADCIFSTQYELVLDGQQTMQAYGSSAADANDYLMDHNIGYDGGQFLIGGMNPAGGNHVIGNMLYTCPLSIGYFFSSYNLDFEVRDNVVVNSFLDIFAVQNLTASNNKVIGGATRTYGPNDPSHNYTTTPGQSPPAQPLVFVRPNKYDSTRANLVVYQWNQASTVVVDFTAPCRPAAVSS